MFDAVINHVSVQHAWFHAFLRDDPHYRDYFIMVEGNPDLSQVVRPRALPLLTKFDISSGTRQVWTTFSEDQIDLNFRNPNVLLEVIDTILYYVEHGAQFIRLDAVAYLWKETGTPCIHLPQTHRIVRLFRSVLDLVAPHVMLITETNVPHSDNISYFGDGADEAQMVYNFALPPLVLHTFYTGNARILSKWADELQLPSSRTTFLNFLASHDGIGINPARGILSDNEIDALIGQAIRHGALVPYKDDAGGALTGVITGRWGGADCHQSRADRRRSGIYPSFACQQLRHGFINHGHIHLFDHVFTPGNSLPDLEAHLRWTGSVHGAEQFLRQSGTCGRAALRRDNFRPQSEPPLSQRVADTVCSLPPEPDLGEGRTIRACQVESFTREENENRCSTRCIKAQPQWKLSMTFM